MIQQAGDEYAAVKRFDHLHNVLFDIAAQAGVVGIVFYRRFFYSVFRQARVDRDVECGGPGKLDRKVSFLSEALPG